MFSRTLLRLLVHFPDGSLTAVKFPDISRSSTQVMSLTITERYGDRYNDRRRVNLVTSGTLPATRRLSQKTPSSLYQLQQPTQQGPEYTYYDLYHCKTTKVIKQVADLRVKYLANTVAIHEKVWIKIPTAPKWGNVIFL